MNFRIQLEPMAKLARIGEINGYEAAGDAPHAEPTRPGCFTPAQPKPTRQERNAASLRRSIMKVATPRGPKPVLRTMMTTACERNCFYCPFRAGRSSAERLTLQPDELADGFTRMQKAGMVDGLFLSSGIIGGGVKAQDKIIDTAEILRKKRNYPGYIHLKIMPGSEYEQVRRSMQLADRVSINLEGATAGRLASLAPQKEFWDDLMQRLLWTEQIRSRERVRASSVTQFVVGAVGDTDLELVSLSEKLYRQARLSRVYYSSFYPVPDTPFDDLPPASLKRQHRLYQASFLLRDYNWDTEDIGFGDDQNLRLDVDPKQAWADIHLRAAPIELNRADRPTLLRVPGIGPKSADRILRARRQGNLTDLQHLRALGVPSPQKAAPYVLLNGRQPAFQMSLFQVPG
ncbi:MAG: radical SAM protein [Caldilineaceae bacterium]|nr:radical SAM protein [Caldilineaceae bacterium]